MKEFIKLAAATILYKEMKKTAVGALGTSSAFSGPPSSAAPARNGLGLAGQSMYNRTMGNLGMSGMGSGIGSASGSSPYQPPKPASGSSTMGSNAMNMNTRATPTSLTGNEVLTNASQLARGVTPAQNLMSPYDQSQARINSGVAPSVFSDSQNRMISSLRGSREPSAVSTGNRLMSGGVKGITGGGDLLTRSIGRVN